ncbi:DUF2309 domain-containing protein [Halalkalibaculum sp. DA3122]|uniref:DUF2309 domain-containing protein n=1 Tax=Halalkalibaculum sp. DA3122 TaxID=3373607 RepID=UPI0037547F4F
MNEQSITSLIQELSEQLVQNWPLYSFVTSNPLSGLEDLHFEEAISNIRDHISINGYPSASVFKQAWKRNQIKPELIEEHLLQKDITLTAGESLERMKVLEAQHSNERILDEIDRHLIKWLAVFMDQGSTEWSMPDRQQGFYRAWRNIAYLDVSLPNRGQISMLPETPVATLQHLLKEYNTDAWKCIFKHHLLALPGWTGYIAYRSGNENDWQNVSPVSLIDYLAVRLSICFLFQKDMMPDDEVRDDQLLKEEDNLKAAWLKAMEHTYQEQLFEKVSSQHLNGQSQHNQSPDAQLVFCIDTRSERIRRAVEQAGPYQTFGYAGFFGIPMDYKHPEKNITNKSCPPILESAFVATETTTTESKEKLERFNFYNNLKKTLQRFRFTLKNNVPASFGYVESAGLFYGTALLFKTLAPDLVHRFFERISAHTGHPEWFSDVSLSYKSPENSVAEPNLSTAEKAEIAQSAFSAMGWQEFAPLVVWAGHGSDTANNPFGSSLDCGACAGNKGRHNARVMAQICNDPGVRKLLAEEHGIHIPDGTWFLAAEHNTTTNAIELFDQQVPEHVRAQITDLKKNLSTAQDYANMEQFNMISADPQDVKREAGRRAADWAETRPEWGLAGNASFIIGPREMTSNLNLEARSFLHSYNWRKDTDGEQLAGILQGPMVVTQWINNHYYFSTVDNDHFGGGSKVTQNVTGKYGVVQGNGGDLRPGLPQESLQVDDFQLQHFPLRLTVLVHAPKEWVESILREHRNSLGNLVEHEWIYLTVIDPKAGNTISYIGQEKQEVAAKDEVTVPG